VAPGKLIQEAVVGQKPATRIGVCLASLFELDLPPAHMVDPFDPDQIAIAKKVTSQNVLERHFALTSNDGIEITRLCTLKTTGSSVGSAEDDFALGMMLSDPLRNPARVCVVAGEA